MKKPLYACLISALFMTNYAWAEALSLQQAFEKAKLYDATIRAAKADNSAQKEEINKTFSAFLPQARLSMYEGRGNTDAETPGLFGGTNKRNTTYDSRNYSFTVRQPLFNKAIFADYAKSKAEVAKSDANFEKEQLSLMSRVTAAYFEVLLAAENLQYSHAQRKAAEQQLMLAEKRVKAGAGTITEVSEAKATLESVTAQAFEWENSLEYAKRTLETICGQYIDQFYMLDSTKLKLKTPEPNSVDEWVALGMQKNPEIIALLQEVNVAQEEINKSNSGHLPTLELVAARTKTESDNNFTIGSKFDTDTVGLQLNLPIFAGGYVMSAVRQAQARLLVAEEKLSDKQRNVANDVRKYFNEIINGIARVEAQTQAVNSNEVAVIGTQKGYLAGMRTNVEVLNAQDKLYSAIRDLARDRYKLLFSQIMLKQTTGTLLDADLAELSQLLSKVPQTD